VRTKKATAGERHVAWWTSQTLREFRNDPTGKKEAEKIDQLLERERRRTIREVVKYLEAIGYHNAASWVPINCGRRDEEANP
jgi:hypothetical protein